MNDKVKNENETILFNKNNAHLVHFLYAYFKAAYVGSALYFCFSHMSTTKDFEFVSSVIFGLSIGLIATPLSILFSLPSILMGLILTSVYYQKTIRYLILWLIGGFVIGALNALVSINFDLSDEQFIHTGTFPILWPLCGLLWGFFMWSYQRKYLRNKKG